MRTYFYYFLWTLYCNPWSLVSLARCSCVAVLVCFIWLKWIGKLKRNCDLLTFPWRCREFRWRHTRCFRSLCCLDTVLCQGDRSWRWWCECWSRCHSWLIPHYLGRHTPLTLNKHCGLVNREEKRLAIPRLYPYQLDQQLLSRGKSALNMGPLFRDPIQSIKLWIPSNPRMDPIACPALWWAAFCRCFISKSKCESTSQRQRHSTTSRIPRSLSGAMRHRQSWRTAYAAAQAHARWLTAAIRPYVV